MNYFKNFNFTSKFKSDIMLNTKYRHFKIVVATSIIYFRLISHQKVIYKKIIYNESSLLTKFNKSLK